MSRNVETDLMMDDVLSKIMEDVAKRYPSSQTLQEPSPVPALREDDAVDAIGWDGAGILKPPGETFPRMLGRMLYEKGIDGPSVYKKIGMDRKVYSKIASVSGKKSPTKGEVMGLAIGMGLSLAEARVLMASAGFAFWHGSKVDCIIMYYLSRGEHDVITINEALWSQAQITLYDVFKRSK